MHKMACFVVVFIAALYVSQCSANRRASAIDRLNYLMKKGSSEACTADCLNTAFKNYKDAVDRCNAPPASSCVPAGGHCTGNAQCCSDIVHSADDISAGHFNGPAAAPLCGYVDTDPNGGIFGGPSSTFTHCYPSGTFDDPNANTGPRCACH
ncbi:unnamed protein product [Adineta steineri]|uniref:Uncharacterized protein n=1 Tax=Adineta steineri TaxID=433720 RepID=A0A820CQL1_9BILA|nr:unnamed protein product [Adineta steineri]CAF4226867.1 unnamed protein product [Adineta steineri]